MSFLSDLKRTWRVGYACGYGHTLTSLTLAREGTLVTATLDLAVVRFANEELNIVMEIKDAETDLVIHELRDTISLGGQVAEETRVTIEPPNRSYPSCYAVAQVFYRTREVGSASSEVLAPAPKHERKRKHEQTKREPSIPKTSLSMAELLGISAPYSAGALKVAFKRVVAEWHPDRFARSPEPLRALAAEQTRRIIAAYEQLSKEMSP